MGIIESSTSTFDSDFDEVDEEDLHKREAKLRSDLADLVSRISVVSQRENEVRRREAYLDELERNIYERVQRLCRLESNAKKAPSATEIDSSDRSTSNDPAVTVVSVDDWSSIFANTATDWSRLKTDKETL
jgi:predicted RNase H-like nuclease (RuvC/YqgF family)